MNRFQVRRVLYPVSLRQCRILDEGCLHVSSYAEPFREYFQNILHVLTGSVCRGRSSEYASAF